MQKSEAIFVGMAAAGWDPRRAAHGARTATVDCLAPLMAQRLARGGHTMRALLLRRRVQSVTFLVPVSVPCYPRRCAAEHRLEPLGEVHRLQAPRGTHCEHRRRDIPAVAAPMLQGHRGRVHREAFTGGRTAALCRRQGAHRGVDGLECRIGERSAAQHGSQQQPQHQEPHGVDLAPVTAPRNSPGGSDAWSHPLKFQTPDLTLFLRRNK